MNSWPAPLRGAFWTSCAVLCFAAMINLVRYLSDSQHTLEIVFFRNLFGLLALLPWLLRNGPTALRTSRLGLHMTRAALGLASMVLWFSTLRIMPVAEATALSYLAPVMVSILAVPFLGERLYPERIVAVTIAFAGALLIARPGTAAAQMAALVALATATAWAFSSITVKMLARTEPPALIAAYMILPITPVSLIIALPVWQWPSTAEWIAFAALGTAGTIGHVCMARALAATEAGIVATFDYLRLPAVALTAYLAFGEIADATTWIGGAVIAASGIFVIQRESKRHTTTPPN